MQNSTYKYKAIRNKSKVQQPIGSLGITAPTPPRHTQGQPGAAHVLGTTTLVA
ncbi:hypothetical protein CHS0354_010051, partial [Potamilus streckersoni]